MKQYFFGAMSASWFLIFSVCCILSGAGLGVPLIYFVVSGLGFLVSSLLAVEK